MKNCNAGLAVLLLTSPLALLTSLKPTGQGTGLGLSLSYDIIKAHGGEIKVKTVPGEGAEFILILPIV